MVMKFPKPLSYGRGGSKGARIEDRDDILRATITRNINTTYPRLVFQIGDNVVDEARLRNNDRIAIGYDPDTDIGVLKRIDDKNYQRLNKGPVKKPHKDHYQLCASLGRYDGICPLSKEDSVGAGLGLIVLEIKAIQHGEIFFKWPSDMLDLIDYEVK